MAKRLYIDLTTDERRDIVTSLWRDLWQRVEDARKKVIEADLRRQLAERRAKELEAENRTLRSLLDACKTELRERGTDASP